MECSKVKYENMPSVNVPNSKVFNQSSFKRALTYKFKKDDVVIISYPKAGVTWIQEIVFLLLNDNDAELSDSLGATEKANFIERTDFEQYYDKDVSKKGRKLFKTHLPFELLNKNPYFSICKKIIMLRNPKDNLVSYYHFHKMVPLMTTPDNWTQFFDMYKSNNIAYGSIVQHTHDWLKIAESDSENYLPVQYELLKKDTLKMVEKIATFLKVSFESQENIIVKDSNVECFRRLFKQIIQRCSFDSMSKNPALNHQENPRFEKKLGKFMRKGTVGDWKNYFSKEESDYIDNECLILNKKFDFNYMFNI